jgi:phage major head subunit gpT-like protein
MPIVKQGWSEALAPGIREWFKVGYEGRPRVMDQLFSVMGSESDSEYFHSFGSVAPDAWDLFKLTGSIPSVDFDKGYKTTFTHDEFVVELPVRRTFIEDNKYAQIADYTGQLGDSASLKRELDGASVFINAASSSYLGGDGVPLCDNSHPASPTKSSVTQDNLDALALSADNVETVRQKMLAVKDDTGNAVGVRPDLLVVAGGLENTAKNITEAQGKTGSADNDINPQAGRFRHLVHPYLTSATQWFMIDSVKMKQSLIWFDRIAPGITKKVQDETIFATWIARMRYSYGWRDWRWINRGNA